MSRQSGSSGILFAVFLAALLLVVPVCAENVSTSETTAAPVTTTTAPPPTTTVVPATTTAAIPATTTVPATTSSATTTTVAPATTTVSPAKTTAAPATTVRVTTRPSTTATTVKPATPTQEIATNGSVAVYSSPAGASILIDGIYSGTTPRTVNGVPAGNHILRLTLSGYYDYEGSVYVVPGQVAQGYGTLQPMSQVTSAVQTPLPTAVTAMIVTAATPRPESTDDAGLLGDASVIAALIGAIGVVILSGAKIFTHVRPPKKE